MVKPPCGSAISSPYAARLATKLYDPMPLAWDYYPPPLQRKFYSQGHRVPTPTPSKTGGPCAGRGVEKNISGSNLDHINHTRQSRRLRDKDATPQGIDTGWISWYGA